MAKNGCSYFFLNILPKRMALTEDTILPLPDKLIAKGSGFSLDIGRSIDF